MRIAYMLGTFPAVTETFVVREIHAMMKKNFEMYIFALRRSDHMYLERSLLASSDLESRTLYARPDSIADHLGANMSALIRSPIRYLSSLKIFCNHGLNIDAARLTRLVYHFFAGVGFSEKIRRLGISHIHSHFSTGSSMALAAHLLTDLDFSFTAHASGDIFVRPVLLEAKIENAKFVVAVCDYSKKYLNSVTNYKFAEKISTVYNGIVPSESQRMIRDSPHITGNQTDELKIISVGSLVGAKGFYTLIETCRILKERGYQFKCKIIGDGPQREVICGLLTRFRLEGVITVCGYLPLRCVYQEMANSAVFVLLSETCIDGYRDGFPTVILEAMLMSLPVVSTWVSGIPEMVIHGETGFLVQERDYLSAADAIGKLFADREMRHLFGKKGRERALENFNSELNVNRFIRLMTGQTSRVSSPSLAQNSNVLRAVL